MDNERRHRLMRRIARRSSADDRHAEDQTGHYCSPPAAQENYRGCSKRLLQEQVDNSHHFSDEFPTATEYRRLDEAMSAPTSAISSWEKAVGDYLPGAVPRSAWATQQQAKQELGALIAALAAASMCFAPA